MLTNWNYWCHKNIWNWL